MSFGEQFDAGVGSAVGHVDEVPMDEPSASSLLAEGSHAAGSSSTLLEDGAAPEELLLTELELATSSLTALRSRIERTLATRRDSEQELYRLRDELEAIRRDHAAGEERIQALEAELTTERERYRQLRERVSALFSEGV
jgi:chromosome segregation ATPase